MEVKTNWQQAAPGRVTLKTVGRLAGVSHPSVSAVLAGRVTGSGRVSAQTRDRIWRTARELGYRPNLASRGLRLRKSFLVGVLFYESNANLCHDFACGLQETLVAHDYAPLLLTHRTAAEERRNLDLCLARGVDGLLLSPFVDPTTGRPANTYPSPRPGLVLVELFTSLLPGVRSVSWDMQAAGRGAVEYLRARGHRRIALLTHDRYERGQTSHQHVDAWDHSHGYHDAMRAAGTAPVVFTFHMPNEFEHLAWVVAGEAVAPQIVAAKDRLTAVVCYSDWEALGLIRGLQRAGVRVPEDISVVGRDDVPAGSILAPALTTWRVDAVATGREAARLFLEAPATTTAAHVTLAPQLVERASVGTMTKDKAV